MCLYPWQNWWRHVENFSTIFFQPCLIKQDKSRGLLPFKISFVSVLKWLFSSRNLFMFIVRLIKKVKFSGFQITNSFVSASHQILSAVEN